MRSFLQPATHITLLSSQDLRIAAIALANDAIVITRNRADYEQIAGVMIEDWTL